MGLMRIRPAPAKPLEGDLHERQNDQCGGLVRLARRARSITPCAHCPGDLDHDLVFTMTWIVDAGRKVGTRLNLETDPLLCSIQDSAGRRDDASPMMGRKGIGDA